MKKRVQAGWSGWRRVAGVICDRSQERSGVYWEKDIEDGAARQEEKRKAKEEVHGCGEGGHAGGWSVNGRCGG